MPFFIRKCDKRVGSAKSKKRKVNAKVKAAPAKRRAVREEDDEEIDSDEVCSGDEAAGSEAASSGGEDVSDTETAQEKRLRLAKLYLEEIKRQEEERDGDVEARLRDEVLEKAGRLQYPLADKLSAPDMDTQVRLRCRKQRLAVTCVAMSEDGKLMFTGSKDGVLVKWNLVEMKRAGVVLRSSKNSSNETGHTGQILSMALSSDAKYLVTGDSQCLILLWEPASLSRLHVFKGHRGPVTGLAFQRGTHQLFSGSADRMLKVWSVDDRAYVETLLGHQDSVLAVDALSRERAISAGGRDNTVRVWKILEESQLVFTARGFSVECVRLINEQNFVTGGQDGYLSLWNSGKKRPVFSVPFAHGIDPVCGEPRWIISLTVQRNSDLVASGSWDGWARVWRTSDTFDALTPLFNVAATGFVNALAFVGSSAEKMVVACGQEHRLGRWWRDKLASNIVVVVNISKHG